jgi:hypothetical protein
VKPAVLLLIFSDVVALLKSSGFITATNDFDDAKFANVQADAAFVAGVEAILKAHGVAVPGKVDSLIQMLPLVASFIR